MEPPLEFAHLSPACDPPERYQAAVELLTELWARVRAFRSDGKDDPFLTALTGRLEAQLVAAGLVLGIQLDLVGRR